MLCIRVHVMRCNMYPIQFLELTFGAPCENVLQVLDFMMIPLTQNRPVT